MANESEHEDRIRDALNALIGRGPVLVRSNHNGKQTARIGRIVAVCERHCVIVSDGMGERAVPWTLASITSVELVRPAAEVEGGAQ